MSDLWDYGTSSSEDEGPDVVSHDNNDECTDRDLGRYMSSEQKKKYRDVLDGSRAPEALKVMEGGLRSVDDVLLVDEDEDEDGFEALWRKDKEEAILVPEYDSDDDADEDIDKKETTGQSGRPKRKRGRPPKHANKSGGEDADGRAHEYAESPGQLLEVSRAHMALRACLQNDDVSDVDVASDEDEDLKRIKVMKERWAKRELDAEVQLISEYTSPTKPEIDIGEPTGGGGGNVIELRFVDSQRHEFVTDAVPSSTFDFPFSKFVAHAIEQGWIKSEDEVLQFVFDDEVLERTEHNPQMFDMEDGDTIDVHYVR